MSNITMKDITIPSLNNTYTFAQVDNTLAVTGAAADAKKTGDEISDLKNDLVAKVSLVSGVWNANGTTSAQATRGRSALVYDIQNYSYIKFPTGYYGRIFYWDENMSHGNDVSFMQEINLTNYYNSARYFAIVVKDSTDDTTDISSYLDTIAEGIILTKSGYTAYDNAIDAQELTIKYRNKGVIFESGSFSGNGVSKAINVSRIRTASPIDLSKITYLGLPSGYELSAYLLDGSMTKISQTGYMSGITFLYEEPTAKYANVFIKKTDDANGDISGYVYTINTGVAVLSYNVNNVVKLPISDFVPDLNIYLNDGAYTTDFIPQSKYISVTNGVTAFLSANGNDSNNGLTVLTPKLTLESALAISNVQTIIVLEGTYSAGTNYTAGLRVTQSVNLVGLGTVVFDNGGNAPITFARSLYCENIHFKQGNDNNLICEDYTGDSIFVLYKCEFSESTVLNGVRLFGGTAYVVECVCHDNAYDGFNYHNKDATPNKTVEINCKSYNNGNVDLTLDAGNTSNASTNHGDCIIIRINGDYKACHGAIIADQGKYSINYGCSAGLSTITDSAYTIRMANYWATGSVEMWLNNCVSYGSKYDTYKASTATLHSDTVYPSMG